MSKENVQIKEGVPSRRRQNNLATHLAYRQENSIEYKNNCPLVINDELKILKLEIVEVLEKVNVVCITFKDEGGPHIKRSDDTVPYTKYIQTTLSLKEFEKRIKKCNNEEEIENLEE